MYFTRKVILLLFLFAFIPAHYSPAAIEPPLSPNNSTGTDALNNLELNLGGLLQGDYRYYFEDERTDNRFDIRRARLRAGGRVADLLRFGLEYELKDNASSNLLDAYVAADMGKQSLVAGQFKEPYSLELQSSNQSLFFAERSMGYYLTPNRDIGVMAKGSLFDSIAVYSVGLFNGNGINGSVQRKQNDEPEVASRLVLQPFRGSENFLRTFSIGGSGTYARIDTPNISINIKSTGMADTSRNLYVLNPNTKYGIIQDVDSRDRWNFESSWTYGPLAIFGEYFTLTYNGLVDSKSEKRNADFSSWYISTVFALTGEAIVIENGRILPLVPRRPFDPSGGSFGAFCLAARYDHFSGDEDWIMFDNFNSVRDAEAWSIAVDWIMTRSFKLILDFTRTKLSDPIQVRVLPDGTVDYIDDENVLTMRFSLEF